ncbi:MAG TPA: hypothetical protein VFQ58_07275 [Flavisolibacter sp.]|nr:hypothetical protein [Flavisolibacter sp.]
MKSGKSLFLIALSAVLFLYSCKKADPGSTGPTGATGAKGSTGTTGGTGSQGPTATSNVITSKWYRVDSSVWTHTDADSIVSDNQGWPDTLITYHAVIPTPLITQGIRDSGIVLFFYKDSTCNGEPNVVTVQPFIEGDYNYTGATNRPTQPEAYTFYSTTDSLGTNFTIETSWEGWGAYFDPNSFYHDYMPFAITHEELAPKTSLYFRCIIIKAAKTQRTKAPVNYKDYNAVLQYYHLEDK